MPVGFNRRFNQEAECPVIKKTEPRTAPRHHREIGAFVRRLAGDARASVFVMMAVGLFMLATAVGVAVDFARSAEFKSELQGTVDAAAIAGASVYLNAGYATQANTAATNYMSNAAANLPTNNGITTNISLSNSNPFTVTITASSSIKSSFNGLLINNIPVTVTALAKGPSNPNIDFYLLLDDSPSMAIAATQAGINTMVANTASQGGCGFGCHESNPSSDNLGNPNGEDNYTLARNLGVTLRIDNVRTATQNLMTTAQSTAASNNAIYRAAIYTFDYASNTIQTLTSNMTTAYNSAANIDVLQVYSNNCLTQACTSGAAGTSDTDTDFSSAMSAVNRIMPVPGNGTNVPGDTPQEVLFLVTDGVDDKVVSTCSAGANCVSMGNGMWRQQYLYDTSWCTTVKNRGIRIAVLYTVYYPLPTNAWYNTYVSPIQSKIGPTLQSCASPGLYFAVSTGGDISAAMVALFNTAIQSAYISQ
jgi:Flp pilus assembly protein TadG